MAAARTELGREATFSERSYAWLTPEAVEVDEVDGYTVSRRRVLLDEVQLVTLHRKRRVGLLVVLGLVAFLFGAPLFFAPKRDPGAFLLFFGLFCSPFAIGLLVHLLLGTDYVTLVGKRSKARMAFNFRKGRAREVYELLVREVQAAQAIAAPQQPAPAVEEPAESPAPVAQGA